MAKPKIKHTITKKEWDKKHKDFKLMGKDGIPYIMTYDSKIGTHLVPVKIIEATDAEEKEFHTKLDTLVHNTFGKSPEEMEESVGAELDLIKQSSKDVKDFIKKVFRDSDFRAMKNDKDFVKYLKSMYEGIEPAVNEAPTKRSNDFFNDSKHGKAIYKLLGGNPFKAGKVKKYLDTLLDKLGDQKGIRVWDFIGKDVGLDVRKYGSQPVRKYEFALIGAIDDLYYTHIKESVNEAKEPEVITQLRKIVKDKQNSLVVDTKSKKKVRVDMNSANLMVQVYDKLRKQSNKDKFVKSGIVAMGHMAYKLMRNESVNEVNYDDSLADFNKELEKTSGVKKAAKHYNKSTKEVVKALQTRIKVNRYSDKSIKKISIDYKEDGPFSSKVSIKLSKSYKQNESVTENRFANKPEVTPKQLSQIQADIKKINRKIKVYISKHPVTKGELNIELGHGHDNDTEIDKIYSVMKKRTGDWRTGSMFNESVNESIFSFKTDNIEQLHFETNPKKAELMKIELGKSQGEINKRKQIESGEYSLRLFRKKIKYGNGKDVGVFLPGSYDAVTSKLGDGPHKKAVKKVKWTQKKYDQWLEDMASNGGARNAFDMAQNAKNEPGLIDWVKKNFRGDKPLQRIQWDIEGFNESVNEAYVVLHSPKKGVKPVATAAYADKKDAEKWAKDLGGITMIVKKKMKGIDEAKGDLQIYHKSYTLAIEEAKRYAYLKGYTIADDELFTKVGLNSKRPSVGKTTRVSLELLKKDKPQRKMLHIQVYGMKNMYELNAYIN